MDLVFRLRFVLLAFLLILSALAAFVMFRGGTMPVGVIFLGTASLAIAVVIGFVHLRQCGLAAAAAVAPLPGMIAAGPMVGDLAYSAHLAVYGFAAIVAAMSCADAVRCLLEGGSSNDAASLVVRRHAPPALLAAVAGSILVVGVSLARAPSAGLAVELIASTLSTLAVVFVALLVLPFSETFFVRANRSREARETIARTLGIVCEPRWALSGSGIVVVFATLGVFGFEAPSLSPLLLRVAAVWVAFAAAVLGLAWIFGRGWRDGLAVALALTMQTFVGLWLWGRAAGHLTATAFDELSIVSAVAMFLIASLLAHMRRMRDDVPTDARRWVIEQMGVAPWFAALSACGAIFPWILLHGSIATLMLLIVLGVAAAMLAMPALATALETVFRRRLSVERLYGRG
ncbi:MAG: hypothetical protein JSR60_12065 [Proteobacteria bacterium]|nr:hypothetical protein [Pseudomonadota bacterium]